MATQPQVLDLRDQYRYTLLHHAVVYHAPVTSLQPLKSLMKVRNCLKDLPIHSTTMADENIKAVKWMLTADVSIINEKGHFGRTPLHCASFRDQKNIVEHLLSYEQIDVNLENERGEIAGIRSSSKEIKQMIKNHQMKHLH